MNIINDVTGISISLPVMFFPLEIVTELFHFCDQSNNKTSKQERVFKSMLHVLNTIFCVIGSDLVEGYENLSINRSEFEGQSVLILGRGNSAFETAQHILGSTNFVHMVSRDRVKLSWSTHYVGDLRAVNNGLLDTYQLKSLDGTFESIRLFHSLLR